MSAKISIRCGYEKLKVFKYRINGVAKMKMKYKAGVRKPAIVSKK